MNSSRFYNFAENAKNDMEARNGNGAIENDIDNDVNNEDDEDDTEFLQDVPYSSNGSFDRSSIGSIPWADDAIKQNQMDWEQVERMISGEEPLPTEPDLRNEILEWQEKFPQLLEKHAEQRTFTKEEYKVPEDLVSHLSLNSSDDEDDIYDDLDTPTAGRQMVSNYAHTQRSREDQPRKTFTNQLSAKMALLRVTALPLRLSERSETNANKTHLPQYVAKAERGYSGTLKPLSSSIPQASSSPKPLLAYFRDAKVYDIQQQQQRYRMPPILNVVESKRRFRDMSSHKSFVQLTTPHHSKSAALIRQTDVESPLKGPQPRQRAKQALLTGAAGSSGVHPQSAWQRPLMAARTSNNFLNNRNAIILPALNTQRLSAQQQRRNSTLTMSPSTGGANTRTNSLSNSNNGFLSSSSSAHRDFRSHHIADRFVSRWQQLNAANHRNSTSTGTISTGRSISAAIRHNPRAMAGSGYSGDYVPSYANMAYNKHNSFK